MSSHLALVVARYLKCYKSGSCPPKQSDEKANRLLEVMWDKFNSYCSTVSSVKIDTVSTELRPYTMDKYDEIDIETGKNKWRLSLNKVLQIFTNMKDLHLLNFYKFDNAMLADLIKIIQNTKLRGISFLYYDYIESDSNGAPINDAVFMNPDKLNKRLLGKLNDLNWKIAHHKIGAIGYKIRVFKKKSE